MKNNQEHNTVKAKADSRLSYLKRETYKLMLKVFLIVSIPAIIGSLLGNFIDKQLDIKPYGSLGTLFVFYLITWTIVLIYSLNLKKQFKESAKK